MYNKIDLREVPAERLKEISLDLVDIDVKAPEFEPNRQFYFMAKARDYVKRKSAELGRPMTFFTQTFGCRIGGEQSGHIIFSKYASTGDGILTSLKMMEVMLAKKKPMSELAAPLKIYPQVLENVRVTDKKAAQNDPAVQEIVNTVAEALGDTGRILVRESGTEPVVRVMVEAPDHDTCQKYVDEVVNVICEKGYKA